MEILTIADAKLQATSKPAPDIARLTAEMARGNERAYQEFYGLYFDRLLRYLLVVTRNEEQAREALQATLVRVARYVKEFDSEAAFWSWVTVLARSSAADERRRSRRYLNFLARLFERKQTEGGPTKGEADARLVELLEKNMAGLPEEERELLERKYFEGESVQQIAEQMQVSEKSVESRLSRVRRRLKDEIVEQLRHEK
jgi:RNA polymerase sigma-70 factor (ECF subfamily)